MTAKTAAAEQPAVEQAAALSRAGGTRRGGPPRETFAHATTPGKPSLRLLFKKWGYF